MEIYLKRINKCNNRITVDYEISNDLKQYIVSDLDWYYEYPMNIENVSNSLLIIPFLGNLLPLCYCLDATIKVDELDSVFFDSIDNLRKGYQTMIPMIEMKGTIYVNKVVKNTYDIKSNAALFSGGVDAMNTLVQNVDEINDLVTIWGSDIADTNDDGWNVLYQSIEEISELFSKRKFVIKSNFRKLFIEKNLNKLITKTKDNWWHGFQHGVALISQVAPLSYLNGYKIVYIASSFTKDFNPICASNPLTDNAVKYGNTITIHDGFEFDRCDKIINIFNYIEPRNLKLNLHVCWQSDTGSNCGHCEKCYRTYLNCRAVNKDPKMIGLNVQNEWKQIRRYYHYHERFNTDALNRFNVIKRHIKTTYNTQVPNDLKWIMISNFKLWNYTPYNVVKRFLKKILDIIKPR